MKSKMLVVALFFFFGCLMIPLKLSAVQTSEVVNEPVVKDELKKNVGKFEALSDALGGAVEEGKLVGCSVLVRQDGKETFYGAWGQKDREEGTELTRDTIFRIYSMSKPITSIAVMQLVEAGKIGLDKPIGDYLPEFKSLKVLERDSNGGKKFKEVDPKRVMTTRDLLRHTSGLTYGFFGNSEVDKRYRQAGILMMDPTISETVKKLGEIPLLHHPGQQFHYSVSTDVLGRVVEVVSGEEFSSYLKTHVFEPLDMNDTFFSIPKEKQARLAQMYQPVKRNGELKPASPWESVRIKNVDNKFCSGGGGLCSTIDDYAKFCDMLVNEGKLSGKDGERIVSPETLKQMFTNQLEDIERSPGQFKFGLGFRVFGRGDFGWGGAAGTNFWVHPEKKLSIIYMTQVKPYDGRNLSGIVREETYKAIK